MTIDTDILFCMRKLENCLF